MDADILKIPAAIRDDMIRHAHEGLPMEVCGILGGKEGIVSVLYRVANAEASGVHFLMDPCEQFAAMEELEAGGLEIIAFYHSHPANPAWPSVEDVRLAFWPDVFIVIVSLLDPGDPDLKAFRIVEKEILPRQLEIICSLEAPASVFARDAKSQDYH